MDVSVVLPTWNRSGESRHSEFLDECLASLCQQDFDGSWELLIGTEMPQKFGAMSLDVIESWREPFRQRNVPLKVLVQHADPDSGHGPTDNDLYAMARGKYVTRPLGDDELYRENFISRLFVEMEGEEDAVLAYADFEDIDDKGNVLRQRVRGGYTDERIRRECFIGICVLIDLAWWKEMGYQWSNIKAGEDWQMWKEMAEDTCPSLFLYVNEFLGQWRDWSGTLTSSVRKGDIEAMKDYTA